ncbi:hypothetical protein XO10_07105 [Marinitoga sp. 1135]|uniref:Lipoprotein n=1 Tax=Marinitoga piezophila (strain DSM 14283 / JCM 11233 / KA3) TaxID=443254 RepID=H2J3U5_MARPK|nr:MULTISPECIES: hypothetical protein [Marinitoga]AEX85837.1 Protein of unknown function, DUF400 [Marinitoga piezophila KA3]APT76277.1 hypothetical protein LN42_07700 [Marinitoga sp. 1137]NUU96041.1 hypothetical protein [Marinitoga sp. 1135]NUU97953.1 hypothetical protein [Marinitoga sp. 1138]
MRKTVFLILLFLLIIFSGCSSQQNKKEDIFKSFSNISEVLYKEIVVIGEGISYKDAEANARVQALQNIVGMKVYSQTTVRNYKLVDKKILSKTYGFIKKSEILEKSEKDGIFTVKVKYYVSPEIPDEDYFYILQQMRKPRIGILIHVFEENSLKYNFSPENIIASELTEKYGFNVVHSNELMKYKLKSYNSIDLSKELFDFDVLIVGDIHSKYLGEYQGLKTARANLDLKVYWVGNGKLITGMAKNSSGADITVDGAINRAINKVSSLISDDISMEIIKKWMDYLANGLPIRIKVEDISTEEYKTIENMLKTNFDINSFSYIDNAATFDIESTLFTDEIYNRFFIGYKIEYQNMLFLVIK